MYMLYHLTSHVNHVKYHKPEVAKKRKSLTKQVSKSEMAVEENEEVKEDKIDEDSSCTNCEMAFENKLVLIQHLEEIHV